MMEGTEIKHWTEDIQHTKLADPKVRESFNKAYGKYETSEEALLGGLEAIKMTGAPFKLPESLDKLPDDKTRGEFTANTLKLLGAVDKEEALDDLDYRVGLPKDRELDNALIGRLKKYAVEKHWPKSFVQDVVELHNIVNEEFHQNITTQYNEKCVKANAALLAACNNDEKKVAEKSELVRRMFQNSFGFTAEEYGQIRDELVNNGWTVSPLLNNFMIAAAEKLVAEGTTETGEGGKEKEKPKGIAQQLPGIAEEMGWDKK